MHPLPGKLLLATLLLASLPFGGCTSTPPQQQLRAAPAEAAGHLRLTEKVSGLLWYEGPGKDLDLQPFLIHSGDLVLNAEFSRPGAPTSRRDITLRVKPSPQGLLHSGLVLKIWDGAAPPAGAAPLWTRLIASPLLLPDEKERPAAHACPRYAAEDFLLKENRASGLFEGLVRAPRGTCLQVLASDTVAFGDDVLKSPGAAGLLHELDGKGELQPLRLRVAKTGEAPLRLELRWRLPGSTDFVPVPPGAFFHFSDPAREQAMLALHDRNAPKEAGYRQLRFSHNWNDAPAVAVLAALGDAAALDALVQDEKAWRTQADLLRRGLLEGKTLAGSPAAFDGLCKLTVARLQRLRAFPKEVSLHGFGPQPTAETDAFLPLRGLLRHFDNHPLLQERTLAFRGELMTLLDACWNRSRIARSDWGTNDCYGGGYSILSGWFGGAKLADDPLAYDTVRSLFDTHFLDKLGEGLHSDGSFCFHNANGRCLQWVGYGSNWLSYALGQGNALLGSPWQLSPEQYGQAARFVLAWDWSIYRHRYDRNISGRHNDDTRNSPGDGSRRGYIPLLLKLPEDRLSPPYRQALAESLARSPGKPEGPALSGDRFFFRDLLHVHRRADYYLSVKMNSPLVGGPETFAGWKPWNLSYGDGLLTLMRHGDEYDQLPPVFRHKELAGTTQDSWTRPGFNYDRYRHGQGATAGGVSDGQTGHCAFEWRNASQAASHHSMYAFLDDGLAVLVGGIRAEKKCAPGATIQSNLNDCVWRGPVTVCVDGKRTELAAPVAGQPPLKLSFPLDKTVWVLHDGIGYVIPAQTRPDGSPAVLTLNLEERSVLTQRPNGGTPNSGATITDFTVKPPVPAFHLAIDHGPTPQEASAVYAVHMRADAARLDAWVARFPVTVLSNNAKLQAVSVTGEELVHATFHQGGELSASPIPVTCREPAHLMIRQSGGKIKITAADPLAACSHELGKMSDTLHLQIAGRKLDLDLPGKGEPLDLIRGAPVTVTL